MVFRISFVTKYIYLIAFTALLLSCSSVSLAQLTDNSSTFRKINHNSYFRFHYDNDFFTKSDEYYTQGITLEYVHPSIQRFVLSKLLWRPWKSTVQSGISLNLIAYTPTSILSDTILNKERPFDANISLKIFMIQADEAGRQQVSTALSIGILGPAALGNEIQTGIHRWLKNPLPHGWQFQIKNDIILNYQLNYEKQLLADAGNFLLNAATETRLGTLNDKLAGGINFMAGRFNKRFKPVNYADRKTEYYFFAQTRLNFVGYDASLQGGVFNRNSPYTIAAKDITRVTFQADAGVILNLKKFYLAYTQSFLTKEFQSGRTHRWGGITAGFAL